MIKVILGLVAVVFLALAGYMFTQSNKTAEHKVAKKVETKVTTSHEVEKAKVSQPKVKEHLSAKVENKDVVEMDKVIALHKDTEISDSVESSDAIGKGLTLEGIENADVSDEEKERMRDDLAYRESFNIEPLDELNNEEVEKLIQKGVQDGIL